MSTKGMYGLRAVIQIAAEHGNAVSVRTIAARQNLSDGYLEQLLRRLRLADIVQSTRGAHGGYILSRDASEITVADVLTAVGESVEPVQCRELKKKGTCPSAGVCGTAGAWKRINDGIRTITQSMTIESLLTDERTEYKEGSCQ